MNDVFAVPDGVAAGERRLLNYRRLGVLGFTTFTFSVALFTMARLLGGDGFDAVDGVLLACFAAILPWNILGLANAAIGWWLLQRSDDAAVLVTPAAATPAVGPLDLRLALVMPVFDEDAERVLRHLGATVASLEASGEPLDFEVFLLSDTHDPAIAAAERTLFSSWRAQAGEPRRLHYRRRRDNRGQKTGNLWQWLRRRGPEFDLMLVLDADSVMSGAAVLRLVRVMQGHPEIGILQQLIVGLPNLSPFPRLFQFGMRHGMRAYTVGSAWWHGDCGPYWGHNAVIRVAPFMAHCRLPTLPGGPPLGGQVLSHDQVEAVLMRRAGWQVRVLAEESGSYEENPPTLSDFIKRDLRWCQGNWQYLHLLGRSGLHRFGRLQLGLAVLMYVAGPAWVLFSLVGFLRAILAAQGVAGAPGSPLLGVPAAWEGWALLGAMMAVVFAPKLAGVGQVLLAPGLRASYGGASKVAVSALAELLFSFVLAPIVAVAQAVFVAGMAVGRTIRWEAQLRDARSLSWAEAWRGLWPQTLLGAVLGSAVWLLAPDARLWALLFSGPLVAAVPFAVATSWVGWGQWLARLGIGAVPEEIDPPAVVVASGHGDWRRPAPAASGPRLAGAAVEASAD